MIPSPATIVPSLLLLANSGDIPSDSWDVYSDGQYTTLLETVRTQRGKYTAYQIWSTLVTNEYPTNIHVVKGQS